MFELQDGIGWAHRTQRTIQIGEAQSMVDSFIQNPSNLTNLLLEMKLPYEPVCPSVGQLVVQLVGVSVIIS